ncbi:MAG TPA: peptide-methionine (S)-S-oxide reductase MsrA [Chitinophagaceae bacterium]|nr:peptide-methionine (S)-S-oxide reductase MsrA [Chitinophagaceae bacterium]
MKISSVLVMCSMVSVLSCAQKENTKKVMTENKSTIPTGIKTDTATFGTGCFWCTEAVFQQLEGVHKATSGYSGGHVANPSYKEVCTGETGHAECLQIVYDPAKITYDELLEVFWQVHDPTTLNRQGNDVGTQYRSVIFYHDNEQKAKAEKYKAELNKSGAWENPVVTEIVPAQAFYKAEDYHQNYYNENGSQPYCYFVIRPKVEKFQKVFKNKLKHN